MKNGASQGRDREIRGVTPIERGPGDTKNTHFCENCCCNLHGGHTFLNAKKRLFLL